MLNIYAHSLMTATRTDCVTLRDVKGPKNSGWWRWLPWRRTICVDPKKL